MRTVRIYCAGTLKLGAILALDAHGISHVKVLRLKVGDPISVFNGYGGEFSAKLHEISRHQTTVQIIDYIEREVESSLKIHLGQVISRGDKMDFTIQKAVELGVAEITPLFSERCGVKLDKTRLQKKLEHWQGVIISACEQSGRNTLPILYEPKPLENWLAEQQGVRLALSPHADYAIADLHKKNAQLKKVTLLIGPEGGFSPAEITLAKQQAFLEVKLGPRVLRTETAALVTIAILQSCWGDLAH